MTRINADRQIQEAVSAAVESFGQDPKLAERIMAWFESVTTDGATLDDREGVRKHITLLLEAAQVEVEELPDAEDEDDGD